MSDIFDAISSLIHFVTKINDTFFFIEQHFPLSPVILRPTRSVILKEDFYSERRHERVLDRCVYQIAQESRKKGSHIILKA